jgi:NADPH:quinone reductase-like Zn-dependent oxidoreductase
MKALQATIVDGVHKLALKDVPKPSIENPNQILVKVIAAAVNPSDIINSKGTRTLNLLCLGGTCGKKAENLKVAFLIPRSRESLDGILPE